MIQSKFIGREFIALESVKKNPILFRVKFTTKNLKLKQQSYIVKGKYSVDMLHSIAVIPRFIHHILSP